MGTKHAWVGLGLLILAGCYAPVRPDVDRLICASALQPIDPQPISLVETGSMVPAPRSASLGLASVSPSAGDRPDAHFGEVILASAQDKKAPDSQQQGKPNLVQRLQVPAQLEGSSAPPLVMPDPNNKAAFDQAIKKYFPPLPEIGPDPQPGPGPGGRPLALADLQQLARANSPLLRQAASDVEAARGAMQTAGQYANPTFGLEGATAGPGGGPNYGPFFGQTITTMGKLKLARAAAEKDLENAELAYRRAESDLVASVRSGYFSVLVAAENMRQNRALVALTDEIYKVQVLGLGGGEFATYEPMQVGVFAAEARTGLIQARNSYTLAWKQLAANLGLPAMPPTEVVGNIRTLAIPKYRYDTILAHVLSDHTDVLTALNGIDKARFNLRLAQVTPVPDINAQVGVINDESQPGPYRFTGNFQVSVALPVWNSNQGGVWSAQAALLKANEEPHRVRDDLTARVADAYRRYNESFDLLELYHRDILPMQVQAYRATVQRHYGGEAGGVAYIDLVTAEQTLVGVIGSYLTVLQAQWQAVADLGSLLQTNDIFQLAEGKRFAELPDLSHLLELPCCHPCNPLPNDAFKGAQLNWPEGGFGPRSASGLGAPIPGDDRTLLAPQMGTTPSLPAPAQQLPAIGGLQFSTRRS